MSFTSSWSDMPVRPSRATRIGDRLLDVTWVMIPLLGMLITLIAFSRSYPSFGVETDFIGMFVPEAERILAGEVPRAGYHPPLYPLALSLMFLLIGDWFEAGLSLSLLSSVAAMSCGFLLFRRLLGAAAGAAALFGFASSAPFLALGASASSDVFFVALFLASLLAAVAALEQPSWRSWLFCGVLVGLALLTRSNALTLVLIAGLPLLLTGPLGRRLLLASACACGAAAVVLIWAAFAHAAGVPVFPSGNASNLALTYFSTGDRVSAESMAQVRGKFDGLLDVVAHDPATIVVTYSKDGLLLLRSGLAQLIAPPLSLFIGAALVALAIVRHDRIMISIMAILLAQVALVNFKAFDERFYLFLVPVLGAGALSFVRLLMLVSPEPRLRMVLAGGFALVVAASVGIGFAQAVQESRSDAAELAEVVDAAEDVLPPGATVLARKPHLGFIMGPNVVNIPDVPSPNALAAELARLGEAEPIYLYYGSVERIYRPGLASFSDPDRVPEGFTAVARGSAAGGWVLYRYESPSGR